MITIGENEILVVNLVTGLIVFLAIVFGVRKGFLRALLHLAATFGSIYIAWVISPVMSAHFVLIQDLNQPFGETFLAEMMESYINQALWFAILILGIRFLFLILEHLAKGLQKIPVFKEINGLLGGLFGAINGLIYVMVIVFLLYTPLFENGSEIADHCWAQPVSDEIAAALEDSVLPYMNVKNFSELIENTNELTIEQGEKIAEWLEQNGYGNK